MYGAGLADELASKREHKILSVLLSANKLLDYSRYLYIYPLIVFPAFTGYWTLYGVNTIEGQYKCFDTYMHPYDEGIYSDSAWYWTLSTYLKSFIHRNIQNNLQQYKYEAHSHQHENTECPYIYFNESLFKTVSYAVCGAMLSSLITQLIQLSDIEYKERQRRTPIICTAIINSTALFTHLSMARGWFPKVVSVFGRLSHVARWAEWVSLVPVLMIMMNSIDIRDASDERVLWEAAACQTISVILGALASIIQNWEISVILMAISVLFYSHIFYVMLRAMRRYNLLLSNHRKKPSKRSKVAAPYASEDILRDNNYYHAKINSMEASYTEEADLTHSTIIEQVEFMNSSMSLKLVVFCTITWTVKVVVYGFGVLNFLSPTQEEVFQSVLDCVSKSVYARVLCTSHVSSVSPEGLLGQVLKMEEKANASIRQFLRFVYHELATPLNTVSMSVENLPNDNLCKDSLELVHLAKDSCAHIHELLTELLNFQNVEEGTLMLHFQPVNIKILISTIAEQYVQFAVDRGVMLLLAIDPRIPDLVLSDMGCLKRVISVLICNGITFSRPTGTCSVTAELKNASMTASHDDVDEPETMSHAHVKFVVRDDGIGFSQEELQGMFQPYAHLTAGEGGVIAPHNRNIGLRLCTSKQVVEMHGGHMSAQSSLGGGSMFSFDIAFNIASKEISAEYPVEPINRPIESSNTTPKQSTIITASSPRLVTSIGSHMIQAVPSPDMTPMNRSRSSSAARNPENIPNTSNPTPPIPRAPYISLTSYSNATTPSSSVASTPRINLHSPLPQILPFVARNPSTPTINQSTSQIKSNQIRGENNLPPLAPSSTTNTSLGTATPSSNMSEVSQTPTELPFQSKTALVVDDVLSNRKLLSRTLERLGFIVDTCDDGDILVEKILVENQLFDAIFLDNMMPRMRGVDAIKILRGANYQGFVLGVTGNVLNEDLLEFLNAGCDNVMTKPVSIEVLTKCLIEHDVGRKALDSYLNKINQ